MLYRLLLDGRVPIDDHGRVVKGLVHNLIVLFLGVHTIIVELFGRHSLAYSLL